MSVVRQTLSALRRIVIVSAAAIMFLFGLATTVMLSLRSPIVRVPEVVGEDRFEAERTLSAARLNFRVRATRPSNQVKPDTVLFQLPRAGEEVKGGQTVAVDISRAAKEGEASETVTSDDGSGKETEKRNANESSAVNANENKPKRNKNTNKNDNGNANNNRNANANRPAANANANRRDEPADNANSNRSNRNENRPANAPAPAGSNANKPPPAGTLPRI